VCQKRIRGCRKNQSHERPHSVRHEFGGVAGCLRTRNLKIRYAHESECGTLSMNLGSTRRFQPVLRVRRKIPDVGRGESNMFSERTRFEIRPDAKFSLHTYFIQKQFNGISKKDFKSRFLLYLVTHR
jgi:hypothetical protein